MAFFGYRVIGRVGARIPGAADIRKAQVRTRHHLASLASTPKPWGDPVAPPDNGSAGGIDVYGPGMDKAAKELDKVNSDVLRPEISRLGEKYKVGTPLGSSTQSSILVAACTKHQECVVGSADYLNKLLATAAAVVTAIQTVRSNYSAADFSSAEGSAAVGALLNQALSAATQPNTGTGTATTPTPNYTEI
jgi:hypothetical protein